MHKKFDHQKIEKKWRQIWKESGIYDVDDRDASKEKEYVLVELPYPSGNLHIGHWYAFAIPDIYVRAHRMQGKQVLFPMGFDAFGLPAENAAIKRNINPKEWTESNIVYMKKQLESMGAAFSWDKTASTTDPDYYKWTQWMFTKFFENDVAYRGMAMVNWCPGCNTVIANEQVLADGTCERSGDKIEKREMPQWMLRITNYADRLIDDLERLDWPEHIKESQRNWIGRSAGAELIFKLSSGDKLKVFTTRPDTLFGATYMVLAPEHELVEKNKNEITNWNEVDTYREKAAKKSEQDRIAEGREKTGVRLEGVIAINPANNEEIPVFIADYVLRSYGTGAIMAVPMHDDRDLAFALKYNLSLRPVIAGTDSVEKITSGTTEGMIKSAKETGFAIVTTGILFNSGEFGGMDSEEAKEAITKKVGGTITNTYRLRDWSIGRQRYWGVPIPIVYDPKGKAHIIPLEHLPWTLPEDVDFKPTGEPPLAKSVELKKRTEEIFGIGWTPEVETMDTFVDSSWYFLRYLDTKNNESLSSLEAQKKWMPIDIYFGGAEHTTMHLLYSRFWQKTLFDLGLATVDEPYTKRINRGIVLGPDGNKMSKRRGNVIDPDKEVARMGADTVKMYLAFMGPYGEVSNYPWDMGGIAGIRRFLERVYGLSEHISPSEPEEMTRLLHKTIKKVTGDIEQYKFNTAISAMMIFINSAEKKGLSKDSYKTYLRVLAAFAPHLAEELWHEAGEVDSIHTESWPSYDEKMLLEERVTIAIQIDGKMRGTATVPQDATEKEALEIAQNTKTLQRYLDDAKIAKVIYVQGRILNLITSM